MQGNKSEGTTVILIVGYRYAGKSLVLQHLERSGYRCVDNLPEALIADCLSQMMRGAGPARPRVALAVDTGTGNAVPGEPARPGRASLLSVRDGLAAAGHSPFIVFLAASDSALKERHAASQAQDSSHDDSERRDAERAALAPLREAADLILDSSYASPTDERDRIIALAEGERRQVQTVVEVSSFGFKYGVPAGDIVLDVRFIPNPYYVSELRPLTGKDRACADYVFGEEGARVALEALVRLVGAMAPAYEAQGKPVLRVRIGCTGGQHRSVAMAEALGRALAERGLEVQVRHRELARREKAL
jgi:UPF0042 nucleotide-binding protein